MTEEEQIEGDRGVNSGSKQISRPSGEKDVPVENEESSQTSSDDGLFPQDLLEQMPPEMQTITKQLSFMATARPGNPLSEKITSEHITDLIENDAIETKQHFDYITSNRYFSVFYALLAVLVLGGLTLFFGKDNPDLYVQILSHFFAVVAGAAAGWGYSETRK